MNNKNFQHDPNSTRELDNVRRELDTKIGQKISTGMFRWVLGFVIAVIGYLCWNNYDLSGRVIALETKESVRETEKTTVLQAIPSK
jgi:hypothetical protein